jgi:hypothetical protein
MKSDWVKGAGSPESYLEALDDDAGLVDALPNTEAGDDR